MNIECPRISTRPLGRWLPFTTAALLAALVAACATGPLTAHPVADPGTAAGPDAGSATMLASATATSSASNVPEAPLSPRCVDPQDDSHLGCTRATFPPNWHRSELRGVPIWSCEPVRGPDGLDRFSFAAAWDISPDIDPIMALANAGAKLRESKPLLGDGKDYPLEHSLGRRGYFTTPGESLEHVNYVLIVGCGCGRSQMVLLDTPRDTEEQFDGELRGVLQSMRFPVL
jgi:hypothetical protein